MTIVEVAAFCHTVGFYVFVCNFSHGCASFAVSNIPHAGIEEASSTKNQAKNDQLKIFHPTSLWTILNDRDEGIYVHDYKCTCS
jgi:hypothetical protein